MRHQEKHVNKVDAVSTCTTLLLLPVCMRSEPASLLANECFHVVSLNDIAPVAEYIQSELIQSEYIVLSVLSATFANLMTHLLDLPNDNLLI